MGCSAVFSAGRARESNSDANIEYRQSDCHEEWKCCDESYCFFIVQHALVSETRCFSAQHEVNDL